ncbi:MAG: hypothetical protein GWM88_16580 [Pseudomonadales bacterium]|nr:protein BatD [Pseudomonadales bacterium]NIX09548.1 hypothetical protein [Pseudomonadales bacterium]
MEPRLLDEMDTVRLTLRTAGSSRADGLELAPLEENFEVLGTNTQSQYRSVNGRIDSWVEHQIDLRPRRTGELLVPSITVGGEQSEAIRIVVRPMDPSVRRAIDRMVYFESELSRNPVYVQSETIFSRTLYYSSGVQIYSDLPGAPEVPDAVVIPVGETRSSSTLVGGQRYGVIEQQFAIFPERSGAVIIPETSITSSVRMQTGGRYRRSGIRVSTEAIELEVLPIPAVYPQNEPWLPATEVRLADAWSPSAAEIAVGDPVERRFTLIAKGNIGSAIPPIKATFPEGNLKSYPQSPVIQDDTRGSSVVGTRQEAYALIAVAGGELAFPPVEVTWWDIDAERVRTSRVDGRTVRITGTVPSLPAEPGADEPVLDASTAEPEDATATGSKPEHSPGLNTLLVAGVIATCLLVAGVWAFSRRIRSERGRTGPTPRQAWSSLRRSCENQQPEVLRAALLRYLEARFGPNGLDHLLQHREGREVWQKLNESLFSSEPGPEITGDDVIKAVALTRRSGKADATEALPELYA